MIVELVIFWLNELTPILFINTISRHMKFMTEEHTTNSEASTLEESIRKFKQVYMQRGFKMDNILMNGQFACIRGGLAELHINLDICYNDDHVGDIERLNRTVKEGVREIYNTLPFNKLPGRIIVELVTFWLNALPPSPSVGGNLRPLHIITRLTINFTKHCRLQFGD